MTDDGETPEADADRDDDGRSSTAGDGEPVADSADGRADDGDADRPTTEERADTLGDGEEAPASSSEDPPRRQRTGGGGEPDAGEPAHAAGSGSTDTDGTGGDEGDEGTTGSEPGTGADFDPEDRAATGHEPATEGEPTAGADPGGVGEPAGTGESTERDEPTGLDEGGEEVDVAGGAATGDERPPGAVGEFDEGASGQDVPEDVRTYDRFQKVDRASYDRVNEFLRDRTYVTAREWAIARLCADFRTATGVEMTKIGENLPHLVPFMTDTYSPQAVNQARSAFEDKVRMAGATFLYGAMSGFFTADELDDIMYEVTEVAKFLLEVEGVELTVDEELDAEDRISAVMREVRQASEELRYDEVACPHCGEAFQPAED